RSLYLIYVGAQQERPKAQTPLTLEFEFHNNIINDGPRYVCHQVTGVTLTVKSSVLMGKLSYSLTIDEINALRANVKNKQLNGDRL
ncbi:MAG: hypothetical protein MN733_34545, partial [Nitrososphaera sp.]|nr:hypothetical protein [Nitrososphaera sp.]